MLKLTTLVNGVVVTFCRPWVTNYTQKKRRKMKKNLKPVKKQRIPTLRKITNPMNPMARNKNRRFHLPWYGELFDFSGKLTRSVFHIFLGKSHFPKVQNRLTPHKIWGFHEFFGARNHFLKENTAA